MRTKALENHHSSSFWMSTQVKPFRLKFHLGAGVCLVLQLLTSFVFSQTAYAASYINVSSGSGGTVSLGSIRPSSSGTSSTGSDTLTIHTDCSTGYSVYVSGQKDKDTNLTNSSASSNNTIATSSTPVGSTATALSSNTWGLNSENTGTYVGLPTYDNATNKALTSKSSVSESSTVPIYYGVKVDTSLTPGTYTGNVLYTVMMDSSCLAYSVIFDANGGTGTMDNQSIMAGTATNLTANSFTRSGYTFLGWSTKANGKTETAVNGVGTEADVDYTDKAEVTDLTSGGSSITLYAIWQKVDGTMQSFSCTSLASGGTANLQDTRDGQVYSVYRIPTDQTYAGKSTIANVAGKCIMTQDLSLGYVTGGSTTKDSNLTLTTTDSNFDDSASHSAYETVTYEATEIVKYVDPAKSSTDWPYIYSYTNKQYTNGPRSDYESYSSHSYYSWGAALVVCPKGWRLPIGGEYGSYSNNTQTIGLGAIVGNNADGSSALRSSPWSFILGGYFFPPGWRSQGSDGYYWTSTQNGSSAAYYLRFNSFNVYEHFINNNKHYGQSVRCIAQDNYTISYSTDGADSGEASKTSEIVYENGSVTMPTAGTMVKSGYEFKGWSLTSGASEATYTAEETVSLPTLLSAASSAGQTTTPGSTLTLYPVWEKLLPAMQDFVCASLASGATTTLRDARDNQNYTVYRIPTNASASNVAGKCIMTQDLSLGYVTGGSTTKGSNLNLTTTDSNFDTNASNSSYETISYDATETVKFVDSANGGTGWDTTNRSTNKQYTNGSSTSGNAYSQHSYYSWGAALVVCPKGWRLPTSAEYADNTQSGTPTTGIAKIVGNSSTGSSNLQKSPWRFVFGGYFYSSGWNSQGLTGSYWSSTQSGSSYGYYLFFNSSRVYQGNNSKDDGRSVRCIADEYPDDGNLGTFQTDNICSKITPGHTATLTDSRDNQAYSVYHIPTDQTYAGTSTVANVAGKCIMTKDLNLGAVAFQSSASSKMTSANSTMTLSPTDSSFTKPTGTDYEGITVPTSTVEVKMEWNATNSYSNKHYHANGTENYAGRGYYSWGAAMVVCPKGWRLPSSDEYVIDSGRTETQTGGLAAIVKGSNATATISNIKASPYSFVIGGDYSNYKFILGLSYGFYWSSTQGDSSGAYNLYIDSSNGLVRGGSSKSNGLSVRCIAE